MAETKIYEEGSFRFEFVTRGGTHRGDLTTRYSEMPPFAAEVDLVKIRSRAGYVGDALETWGLEKDSELAKELKAALNALCVKRSEEVEAAIEAEQQAAPDGPDTQPEVSEDKTHELVGRPGVLDRLVDAAAAFSKVVGERMLLRLLFLVFLSAQLRLLPSGKPLGVNCVLIADASRGKNYVADAVARVLPEEFYFSFESSSPKSLFYKAKAEGPECLKHRALYPNEAEAVDALVETFRPVLSGGRAKLVTVDKNDAGENVEREYVLEGPMVLVVPTVRNKLDGQLQSRMLVAGLDDYAGRVAAHSGAVSEQLDVGYVGADHAEEIAAWQMALRSLTGVRRVVVPARHEGFRFDSDEVPHGARLWTNFLGLMCAHALLEQRNREVVVLDDGEEAVVASPEDYAAAYRVFEATCERSIENLSEAHRKILDAVYELQQEDEDADGFTQRKIADKAGLSQSTVAAHKTYLTKSVNLLREVEGAGLRLVADATPSWWDRDDLLVGFPRPSEVRRWWTRRPAPPPRSADRADRPPEVTGEPGVHAENADRPAGDRPLPAADHHSDPDGGDRQALERDREGADQENGLAKGQSDKEGPQIGVIGGLGNDEKGVDVNGQHGGEGERTATEKPKMGIIEYEPSGIRRYGLDNLHLGHPVLGAILWSGLADPSWEGSLSELLDILNDNVEDRVKELPEWPSSPEALYMCLWVYLWEREGYLFSLFGGDIWVQAIWDERPEMSKVLIELVLPDEFGNDEQDDEGEHYAGFQFDFDWIDSDEREEG